MPNRPCRREWAVARPAEQKLAHLLQSYELLISRVEVKRVAHGRRVPSSRRPMLTGEPNVGCREPAGPAPALEGTAGAEDVFGRHPTYGSPASTSLG